MAEGAGVAEAMGVEVAMIAVVGREVGCGAGGVAAGPNWQATMTLGNGDIRMNLWVEPGGDLQFYISKTDCWDEVMRLPKVGLRRARQAPLRP